MGERAKSCDLARIAQARTPSRSSTASIPTLALGLAAVVAIGLAAGLPIGGGDGGSAAYAVTRNANGTVTVQINALRDADGVQRKLREAGVPALVQYRGGRIRGRRTGGVPKPSSLIGWLDSTPLRVSSSTALWASSHMR